MFMASSARRKEEQATRADADLTMIHQPCASVLSVLPGGLPPVREPSAVVATSGMGPTRIRPLNIEGG